MINNPIIYKFLKDFTYHWKKTNRVLVFSQKSREPSFWEVMDSFISLAYASLAASPTLL